MNTGTAVSLPKVVLDTNIIISGIGFGGKPRKILDHILEEKFSGVISLILLAELEDVINKKFPELKDDLKLINKQIHKKFKMVRPEKSLRVVSDDADNRVLEAAVEGNCHYIVTGDKELLELGQFEEIKIVAPAEFLRLVKLT